MLYQLLGLLLRQLDPAIHWKYLGVIDCLSDYALRHRGIEPLFDRRGQMPVEHAIPMRKSESSYTTPLSGVTEHRTLGKHERLITSNIVLAQSGSAATGNPRRY